MATKRVYEIAREEGLPSSLLVQRLQRAGIPIKTASSTVDVAEALYVLSPGKHDKPQSMLDREAEAKAKEAPADADGDGGKEKKTRPARRRPTTRRPTTRRPNTARGGATTRKATEAEAPAAEADASTATSAEDAPATKPRPTRPRPRTAEAARSVAEEARAAVPPAPSSVRDVRKELSPEPAKPKKPAKPAPEPDPPKDATPKEAAPTPKAQPRKSPTAASIAEEAAAAIGKAPDLKQTKDRKPAPAQKAAPAAKEPAKEETAKEEPNAAAEPAPAKPASKGGKKRRVVIDSQASRRDAGGPGSSQQGRDRKSKPREEAKPAPEEPPVVQGEPVTVASGATVKDVADVFEVGTAEIIKLLMGMGEMATITQSLSDEAIELVAEELKRPVTITRAEEDLTELVFEDDPDSLVARAPVVTVMGHVDHGKTSLLDAVRKTEVAAGEAGGITQHIGAYQVHHGDRSITFLDTPGHEAFTAMRARGAKVTDVAVIVVAADDGVMPQTREAIDHARAAEVPFIVAVNKIDKPGANPDKVKQELATDEVVPVAWGGDHEFVDVSAKEGTGLEDLLETVLLVADADAEPKANPTAEASGTVIESRLDPGRGPVASLLVQRGTLRVGDVVLAGQASGRVRAMSDHLGAEIEAAGPSVPVELLGLDTAPDAGEKFRVMENDRAARQAASDLSRRLRVEALANRRPVSLDDLFEHISEGNLKELNLVIKADVQGSVGALQDAIEKIDQSEVRLQVIRTGVGAVTESDIMLASASQAIIIAFNVRPRPEARRLAESEGVDVRSYTVIYRAIEDVTAALVGMLEPEIVEEVVGNLEVRATFKASRLGTIAGSYVTEGEITRGAKVRVIRDGTVVHESTVGSLRRFNDDVREVAAGFECGVLVTDFNDVKEGDELEVFELKEVARTAEPAVAE